MRKKYLHLSAYLCDTCAGPVIAGSLAVRENEISKGTMRSEKWEPSACRADIASTPTAPARVRHLLPMEWSPTETIKASHLTTALEKPSTVPTFTNFSFVGLHASRGERH